MLCDGTIDCPEGEDEVNCSKTNEMVLSITIVSVTYPDLTQFMLFQVLYVQLPVCTDAEQGIRKSVCLSSRDVMGLSNAPLVMTSGTVTFGALQCVSVKLFMWNV